MQLRIATFNCENLFSRTRILDFNDTPAQAKQAAAALKAAGDLKQILKKTTFTATDKAKILALIKQGKGFFTVEEDRGKLVQGNKIVAKGSDDVFAHVRFLTKPISDEAIENTGKIIKEVEAHIACVVEVENRQLLGQFNSQVLTSKRFGHHMVIDGNDDRGIDVGVLTKSPLRIIRTHVDDRNGTSAVFSRDCAEYEIVLTNGQSIWVLCNHFKSKGFGSPATNNARRKAQATRVAQILGSNFDLTKDMVCVAGDLNDTPGSDPLSPLLGLPDLHNIVDTLPAGQQFTHIFGNEKSQLDYLLVSTPLRDALKSVTIERRGMFKFEGHFPSIKKPSHEASDHAAVVAEFNL